MELYILCYYTIIVTNITENIYYLNTYKVINKLHKYYYKNYYIIIYYIFSKVHI